MPMPAPQASIRGNDRKCGMNSLLTRYHYLESLFKPPFGFPIIIINNIIMTTPYHGFTSTNEQMEVQKKINSYMNLNTHAGTTSINPGKRPNVWYGYLAYPYHVEPLVFRSSSSWHHHTIASFRQNHYNPSPSYANSLITLRRRNHPTHRVSRRRLESNDNDIDGVRFIKEYKLQNIVKFARR